jgi:putative NADH-flavin reductase
LNALCADASFTVTVLARRSSKSTYPSGVKIVRVEDDLPHEELGYALLDQDVVISAVGSEAKMMEYKVVEAAL